MVVPPHPLAGQKGEGPPIAPAHWKWRCGNRIRDMYFYSPAGALFRSRLELAKFLSTQTDAPSPDDFCWKATAEVLKTGVWDKEESSPNKPSKSTTPKRQATNVETEKKQKKAKTQPVPNGTSQLPSTSVSNNGVQFSQVEPLAIRAPGSVVSKKVTTSRAKAKAKKEKSDISTPHTFKEILSEPSSFKWLYDLETLNKFLDEAGKLTDLSVVEIRELRTLLVERNLQLGNITKYPNSVLRVFLRLLGTDGLGEEPSSSLGKIELADRCIEMARPEAK